MLERFLFPEKGFIVPSVKLCVGGKLLHVTHGAEVEGCDEYVRLSVELIEQKFVVEDQINSQNW